METTRPERTQTSAQDNFHLSGKLPIKLMSSSCYTRISVSQTWYFTGDDRLPLIAEIVCMSHHKYRHRLQFAFIVQCVTFARQHDMPHPHDLLNARREYILQFRIPPATHWLDAPHEQIWKHTHSKHTHTMCKHLFGRGHISAGGVDVYFLVAASIDINTAVPFCEFVLYADYTQMHTNAFHQATKRPSETWISARREKNARIHSTHTE